jgi:transposase InsO family protein
LIGEVFGNGLLSNQSFLSMTDKKEFYQLLTYTDDVNLNEKLQEWEQFYNFNRPHGSFKGKTPYEVLKCKLNI